MRPRMDHQFSGSAIRLSTEHVRCSLSNRLACLSFRFAISRGNPKGAQSLLARLHLPRWFTTGKCNLARCAFAQPGSFVSFAYHSSNGWIVVTERREMKTLFCKAKSTFCAAGMYISGRATCRTSRTPRGKTSCRSLGNSDTRRED